jgi:hypothetical protein
MKNSLARSVGLIFIIILTSLCSVAQATDNANPTGVRHTSGYSGHGNNQNNWGLFVIIGVIALAGLTKRNLPQKG